MISQIRSQLDNKDRRGKIGSQDFRHRIACVSFTNPGTTAITSLAVNSEHGLSFAGEETRTMV